MEANKNKVRIIYDGYKRISGKIVIDNTIEDFSKLKVSENYLIVYKRIFISNRIDAIYDLRLIDTIFEVDLF